MNKIKQKFLSLVVIGYAFTSLNSAATLSIVELENDTLTNKGVDLKAESDSISYVRNRPVLISDFDDGSELSWVSENDVELFGVNEPIGFNNEGLIIKSYKDETNTYANDDSMDVKVTSSDFPLWALSKYKTIEEVEKGIKNIVVSKNKNDIPLSFDVLDINENLIKLRTINGDLKIV